MELGLPFPLIIDDGDGAMELGLPLPLGEELILTDGAILLTDGALPLPEVSLLCKSVACYLNRIKH